MFESIKRVFQKPNPYPLGSELNPVRCVGVMGEHAYLKRLRDRHGRGITYERTGSFGNSPSGNIMDGYKIVDSQGEDSFIYMDMYERKHIETSAPVGFYISNWSADVFKETKGFEVDGAVLSEILRTSVTADKATEILMFCIVWSSENEDATPDELEEAIARIYGVDAKTAKTIGGFVVGY